MTPDAILEALRRAGHGEHADAVRAVLEPGIHLTATALAGRPADWRTAGEAEADADAAEADADAAEADRVAVFDAAMAALPLGASRFGGIPDLPPGAAWPERDGVPMEFIAQFRLDELAGLDPQGRLPAGGALLFFYNAQWEHSDMEPDAACCAVLFHPGPVAELVRATPPTVEWQSEFSAVPQVAPFVHGLAAVRGAPCTMAPGQTGPFVPERLASFWQGFASDHSAAYQPGGADAPQNHLLGYVDAPDYVDAQQPGDQLLFQVSSDDAAEFQFGDCDSLYFILTAAELAARDFSRVRVYQQLG
ncbi:MAG: DUF1963 domain-containing protein [Myxococcales bacterium]|nr:DUF1963 domain-containing protein [Myxococcales bacterium]